MKNCGQRDTMRFAINFIRPSAANHSSLSGVTISNSLTIGLGLLGVSNMAISDMVIYNTVGSNIAIVASSNVSLTVCSASRSPRFLFGFAGVWCA